MIISSSNSKKNPLDDNSSFSFSSAAAKIDLLLEEKITSITEGTEGDNINEQIHYVTAQLRRVAFEESKENALTICDYIEAFANETNPVPHYKRKQIQLLCYLSSFFYDKKEKKQKKLFSEMTRDDVIAYLNSGKKPESKDPLHKWVGTYTLRRVNLMRFFKWLYHPHILSPKDRPIPDVVSNIPNIRRKEISTIKPTDLWTEEDDYIFLKYCPSARDRCYHTVSRDTSARPSEILNLRIKDIVFDVTRDGTNKQFAKVTVSGKTGIRTLPLFNSIPYVKEWINTYHPQRNNPNAFLIPSLDMRYRRFGYKMAAMSLNHVYRNYKLKFFPKLLTLKKEGESKIPEEDKQKIQNLLKKPWNPYIRRHTVLTQKAQILKDASFKQHSGWSGFSQMHLKYVHYYGNESTDVLLEAYGITPANSNISKDKNNILVNKKLSTPKQCPNCSEANTVDAKFCGKCKMILTYDAFKEAQEDQEKKENLLKDVQRQINGQQLVLKVQQGLFQIIATAMQMHEEGILSDNNIVRIFKKGDPKYIKYNHNFNNTNELKKMPVKEKIQRLKEIREIRRHVIQNTILPAVNDIAKYAFNEPEKARGIVKQVMDDQLFKTFFWDDDKDNNDNGVEIQKNTTRY